MTQFLKLIPNSLGFMKSIHGFFFEISAREAKFQYAFGCETFTAKVIRDILKSKSIDTFIDIGANRGWYSLFVSSLDNSIEIKAFEASKKMFEEFQVNIEKNGFRNISCRNIFVGSKTGSIDFHEYLNEVNEGMSTAYPMREFGPTSTVSLSCDKLDNLHKPLDARSNCLVKVDVEGAEPDVLMGAHKLLSFKPLFVMELNPQFMERRHKEGLVNGKPIHIFLQSIGYLQYWIDERGRLFSCVQEFLPHVELLGPHHGANYLFIHKNQLDSDLEVLVSKCLKM